MKNTIYVISILFLLFISCKKKHEEDLNLKHLNHVAQLINNDLVKVTRDITELSSNIQYKVSFDKKTNTFLSGKYHYYPGQILFCSYEKSGTAVYFPANKNIEPIKNIILNSEQADTFLFETINNNTLLAQAYFLDTSSFLRIYPYINVANYLKSSIDLTKLNNYQSVKNKHFYEKQAYWTSTPFADPFGRGWIISCVQPVYFHDKFLAIVSGDITLHSLRTNYLSSETEMLILTDQNGKLICCTRDASRVFNIPVTREYRYYKPVTEDIFMNTNPTLSNHENRHFRKAVNALLSGKNKETFFIENKKYTIYKSIITETDWLLLKITN